MTDSAELPREIKDLENDRIVRIDGYVELYITHVEVKLMENKLT